MSRIRVLLASSICLVYLFATPNARAVFGGVDVEEGAEFARSAVALQMETRAANGPPYMRGTGFLIAPDIVLTAGHNVACLDEASQLHVIFSTAPIYGADHPGQEWRAARYAIVYPRFAMTSVDTNHDLAVVYLSSAAPAGTAAVRLARRGNESPAPGAIGWVAGYGRTAPFVDPEPLPPRLRSVGLELLEGIGGNASSPEKWIVDQAHGVGFCGGDSGAPFFFGAVGDRTVYGIAIHVFFDELGRFSCRTRGAFTNVAHFSDWIAEKLRAAGSAAPGAPTIDKPSVPQCQSQRAAGANVP